jgi:glutamate-1-semialdehyde 2,1-aminomutase
MISGKLQSKNSQAMFEKAKRVIPSGVNSTARSTWSGWEPYPLFVDHGTGSHLVDVDGNEFIDYLLGLGPMLFGHRPQAITHAVTEFIQNRGTIFALPVAEEAQVAAKIVRAVPSVEQVHLTNTGTEAVLYAVRLARAFTGRPKLIRFEGMYHGFSDSVYWSKHPALEQAGPDDGPIPVPQGPGMPSRLEESLIILQWNDVAALERAIEDCGDEIAAVITEPVMLNTGCILPEPGYLEKMRQLTEERGILLIFDEVITGFRLSLAGAQGLFNVRPDLSVFAKGFGGGFPVAALGGRKDVMKLVDNGTVSMAGTYCANGIAIAAANAALDLLEPADAFEPLYARAERLREGLQEVLDRARVRAHVVGIGPAFQVWFTPNIVRNYREAVRSSRDDCFRVWWENMLARGVLFHPGPFENLFMSFAHTDADVEDTLEAAQGAAEAVAEACGSG